MSGQPLGVLLAAIVIRGATLIDGSGAPPLADATVVVDGETIRCVGRAGSCTAPPDARVIEAAGRWLLPGLIDTHVHLDWTAHGAACERAQALRFALGVTTVREAGTGDLEGNLRARERARAGTAALPRVVVSGRLSRDDLERYGAADFPALVALYAGLGVDAIKLKNGGPLPGEVLRSTVAAAHGSALPVYGHVWYGEPPVSFVESAVDAGLDGVSHLDGFPPAALPAATTPPAPAPGAGAAAWWEWTAGLWNLADTATLDALASRLIARGTVLEPVLAQYEFRGREPEPPPALWFTLPGRVPIRTWVKRKLGLAPAAGAARKPVDGFEAMRRFVRDFHAAGGRLVAGSDAEGPLGLHREVRALMQAGVAPPQALRAATAEAAAALGVGERLGTVAAGRTADLVLLAHDPLDPDGLLSAPVLVIKGGVVHDAAALLDPYRRDRIRETARAWAGVLWLPATLALAALAAAGWWLRRRRARA